MRPLSKDSTSWWSSVLWREHVPVRGRGQGQTVSAHRHEPLHSLAVEHLARIDASLRVDGDHVQPKELPAVFAHAAHLTQDLALVPVQEPDVVVGEISVGIARSAEPA